MRKYITTILFALVVLVVPSCALAQTPTYSFGNVKLVNLDGNFFVDGTFYTTVQLTMTAASTNGLTTVPSTYAGADVPLGTQIQSTTIPTSSSQSAGARVFDYRYGATAESYFNPAFNPFNNFSFAHSIIDNLTATLTNPPTSAYNLGVMQNVYDGGSNYSGNKSNYAALPVFELSWSQGQNTALALGSTHYGVGDTLSVSFNSLCFGGSNAQSDEGCEKGDESVSQGNVALNTTIASGGSTGSTSVVLTAVSTVNGNLTAGAGRYLIDITQASSTGLVTTIAGSGPLTYTFSGTSFTTDTITTDSTVITPGVVTITTVATTTGVTANTTLICVADAAKFECAIPTVVAANALTATFRYPHPSGAKVSWGGEAGDLIELNIDRGPSSGQFGYITVINTLRQAWPVIGCSSSTVCQIWNSVAGAYQTYSGLATVTTGSNAYTLYPGAEIVSSQSGGTASDTLTLSQNNVAWANSDTVEVPLYPGAKMIYTTSSMNRWFPSPNLAASAGPSVTFNGRFCCSDNFSGVAFNPLNVTDYAGHGGKLAVPEAYSIWTGGPVRYGNLTTNMPDTSYLTVGCPLDPTSGVQNCNQNSFFKGYVIQVGGNGAIDELAHNPATGQFAWFSGLGADFLPIPLVSSGTAAAAGALSYPIALGYVSCTQANCATSATTLATAPAANTLFKIDAAVGCTASTATATAVLTISYTDVSNTAETIVTGAAACTTLGTASQVSISQPFMAKASTVIQYNLTNANTPLYQARVAIYQESTN